MKKTNETPKTKKILKWEEALKTCMPIVQKLATQLSSIPSAVVDRDDLINCGLIGLMEAHKNYRKDMDTKFSTFAYFRIKGSMLDEIRRYQPHKRNVVDKHKKIQKAQAEILRFPKAQKNARKNLSKLCGYSSKEIDKVAQIISIRRAQTNVEEISREEANPESIAQRKQRSENLSKAVAKLNTAERNVINFRFHRELRLKEIGKELNLSEARIHQLEKSALFKLRDLVPEEDREQAA